MTLQLGDPHCAYCHDQINQGAAAYDQHMAACTEAPDHLRKAATARL